MQKALRPWLRTWASSRPPPRNSSATPPNWAASLSALLSSDGSPPWLQCQFVLIYNSPQILMILFRELMLRLFVMNGADTCWSWIVQIGEPTCWLHFSSLTFSSHCPTCCSSFWGDHAYCNKKNPFSCSAKPSCLIWWCRGEVGKWIAFIAVVLRLFFPRHFPGKSWACPTAPTSLVSNYVSFRIFLIAQHTFS